jgi:hypothetical protein
MRAERLTMASMLSEELRGVLGPLGTLHNRLAGGNGEMWLNALKKFLRGEIPALKPPIEVDHMRLAVGGWKDLKELLRAYKEKEIYCDPELEQLARWPNTLEQPTKMVEFARGSLARLFGFQKTVTGLFFLAPEFLDHYDLELCQSTDGFSIRYRYLLHQPIDEHLNVGMKPFDYSSANTAFLVKEQWERDRRLDIIEIGHQHPAKLGRRKVAKYIGLNMVSHRTMHTPGTMWIFRRKMPTNK